VGCSSIDITFLFFIFYYYLLVFVGWIYLAVLYRILFSLAFRFFMSYFILTYYASSLSYLNSLLVRKCILLLTRAVLMPHTLRCGISVPQFHWIHLVTVRRGMSVLVLRDAALPIAICRRHGGRWNVCNLACAGMGGMDYGMCRLSRCSLPRLQPSLFSSSLF
jgi:hypothetical protein